MIPALPFAWNPFWVFQSHSAWLGTLVMEKAAPVGAGGGRAEGRLLTGHSYNVGRLEEGRGTMAEKGSPVATSTEL